VVVSGWNCGGNCTFQYGPLQDETVERLLRQIESGVRIELLFSPKRAEMTQQQMIYAMRRALKNTKFQPPAHPGETLIVEFGSNPTPHPFGWPQP
jgi:hypothetical protein